MTKGRDIVDTIARGDAIKIIEILDSTDELFAAQKADLDKWNKVLGWSGAQRVSRGSSWVAAQAPLQNPRSCA